MAVTIDREQTDTGTPRRRRIDRFEWTAVAVFAAVRVWMLLGVEPRIHHDTAGYTDISFVGDAKRLWSYPVVLRILSSDVSVVAVQLLVSIVAFGALAITLGRRATNRTVGYTLTTFVLLVAASPRIATWDRSLLTESLMLSASCLLVVTLIGRRGWAFVALFVFWLFLRDSHVYLSAFLVPVAAWRFWDRKVIVWALAGAVVWAGVAANMNDQIERINAKANITWLADELDLAWFAERGMPMVDGFEVADDRSRVDAAGMDPAFQAWLDDVGPSIWPRYLLSHPVELVSPLARPDRVFVADRIVEEGLPAFPVLGWIWPTDAGTLPLTLAVFALGLGSLAVVRRRWDRRMTWCAVALSTCPPHLLLAYHASPIEHARHSLLMTVVFVIGLGSLAAFAADSLIPSEGGDGDR